jgi:hypothetical protein
MEVQEVMFEESVGTLLETLPPRYVSQMFKDVTKRSETYLFDKDVRLKVKVATAKQAGSVSTNSSQELRCKCQRTYCVFDSYEKCRICWRYVGVGSGWVSESQKRRINYKQVMGQEVSGRSSELEGRSLLSVQKFEATKESCK